MRARKEVDPNAITPYEPGGGPLAAYGDWRAYIESMARQAKAHGARPFSQHAARAVRDGQAVSGENEIQRPGSFSAKGQVRRSLTQRKPAREALLAASSGWTNWYSDLPRKAHRLSRNVSSTSFSQGRCVNGASIRRRPRASSRHSVSKAPARWKESPARRRAVPAYSRVSICGSRSLLRRTAHSASHRSPARCMKYHA